MQFYQNSPPSLPQESLPLVCTIISLFALWELTLLESYLWSLSLPGEDLDFDPADFDGAGPRVERAFRRESVRCAVHLARRRHGGEGRPLCQ